MRGTVLFISLLIPLWIWGPVSDARAVEVAPSEGSSNASSMAKRLDRLIARKPLATASVGMLVVRASDGATVYSRGADRPMIPASNQKILTSIASLSRFGPSHRFATRIWSNAVPDTDGLVDQLLVEGGGDPAMNSEDWWRLAADLRSEGLRGVRGNLWVDDSRFEAPGWHSSWGRISARAYHAPVGALTANYGTFFVSIWPRTTEGASVLVDIDPPVDYLRVESHARTAGRKARRRLSVDRAKSSGPNALSEEVIRVDGIARVGDGVDRFPRSVLDPGLYAGSLLSHQLGANGVVVEGNVLRGTRADTNGGSWVSIMDRPGRAVSEVVALCMKYSNNSIAESLVKNLGAWEGAALDSDPARQGDWTSGIKAMRAQLGAIGVNLGDANLVDGSGLSVQNRITPRAFVNALTVARESFQFGPEFVAAMPIAEVDGTLEKRMRGSKGRVRAKTGLLSDAKVTALSGYAERADGEVLIFSILVNGHSGGSAGAMDAVDTLAATLLNSSLGASAN